MTGHFLKKIVFFALIALTFSFNSPAWSCGDDEGKDDKEPKKGLKSQFLE